MRALYESPYASLRVSDDELLWVGRGCIGEGVKGLTGRTASDKTESMLWALVNRCLLNPYFSRKGYTYEMMWKRFSQPINKKWTRQGRFCKEGGRYHGTRYCAESRLRRRERIRSIEYKDFPSFLVERLEALQNGTLFPPDSWASETSKGRISNWSAMTERRGGNPISETYPWGLEIGGEWFFEDSNLKKGFVSVHISE